MLRKLKVENDRCAEGVEKAEVMYLIKYNLRKSA